MSTIHTRSSGQDCRERFIKRFLLTLCTVKFDLKLVLIFFLMALLNNIIPRAPSKEEYFSVDAKDVEMQNMNASGPRRPEGGLKAGQQQQQQGIRIKKQLKDILNIMLAYSNDK